MKDLFGVLAVLALAVVLAGCATQDLEDEGDPMSNDPTQLDRSGLIDIQLKDSKAENVQTIGGK